MDGDADFVGTRGNSEPYDGVFWLEQVRTQEPVLVVRQAREADGSEVAVVTLLVLIIAAGVTRTLISYLADLVAGRRSFFR